MKKALLIAAAITVSALTVTLVHAETSRTPKNPNNTLENKIQVIDKMVTDGELDKDTAIEIKKELTNCDGTGNKKLGQKYNLHFGRRLGNGLGNGHNQR